MKDERESKIQGRVTAYLRKRNIPYLKMTGFGSVGWPDITACVKGRLVAIEMKRIGKVPTAKQEDVLRQLRDAGGIAVSYDNSEDAIKLIDEIMELHNVTKPLFTPESLHGKDLDDIIIQ